MNKETHIDRFLLADLQPHTDDIYLGRVGIGGVIILRVVGLI